MCLKDEAKTMTSVKTKSTEKHHSLTGQITSRQLKHTESMIYAFINLTIPFSYEGANLIKLLTKSVMEESIKEDMKRQDKIEEANQSYSSQKNQVKLCKSLDSNQTAEPKTFKTESKGVKVKHTVTDLKEDWGLFARLLIVACSRKEIDFRGSEAFQSMNCHLYLVPYSLLMEACIVVI